MKKVLFLTLAVIVLTCALCSCSFLMQDEVIRSVGLYRSGTEYYSDGFQDYIDFGVYQYIYLDISQNKYFSPVAEQDVPELMSYIENYESRMYSYSKSEKLLEIYCFDKETLNSEDWYFYIANENYKVDGSDRKYDNYNIYLINIETKTLYYFHSNI